MVVVGLPSGGRQEAPETAQIARGDSRLSLAGSRGSSRHSQGPATNTVKITGLPSKADEQYLRELFEDVFPGVHLDKGRIYFFVMKMGYQHKTAKVTFASVEDAQKFKTRWPRSDYKLVVDYWQDEEQKNVATSSTLTAPLRSVLVKRLSSGCSKEFVLSITKQNILTNQGKPLMFIWPDYGSARITFETVDDARQFIEEHNGETLPGCTNRLSVRYYLDRNDPNSDGFDQYLERPKTIVRNVAYIVGLHERFDKDALEAFVKENTDLVPFKSRVYPPPAGKHDGRATVSFKDARQAKRCIEILDDMEVEGFRLDVSLFESRTFERLATAVANDHLYGTNTVAYAYDCVVCFETWDERDMIGCVPIGQEETDMETHFLCQECVRGNCAAIQIDGRLADGGTGVPCGEIDCKRVLLWAPVKRVLLDNTTAERLDSGMTKDALREIEGIEYCKEDCGYGVFLDHDAARMQFFSCLNPACMAQFCRICKFSFAQHQGKSCEDVDPTRLSEEQRLRKRIDQAEKFLSNAKICRCGKCGYRFTKDNDGSCNKMTCTRCRNTICYIRKREGVGYDHFGIKCPLFTNTALTDDTLYEERLREAREDDKMKDYVDLLQGNKE